MDNRSNMSNQSNNAMNKKGPGVQTEADRSVATPDLHIKNSIAPTKLLGSKNIMQDSNFGGNYQSLPNVGEVGLA